MYRVALNNLNLKGYDIQIGVTGETQHIDLWTDKNSGQFTDNGKSTHVNFDADRTLGNWEEQEREPFLSETIQPETYGQIFRERNSPC